MKRSPEVLSGRMMDERHQKAAEVRERIVQTEATVARAKAALRERDRLAQAIAKLAEAVRR